MKQRTTPAHEYAKLFPLNEGPPLWELSDRIKANGLREPIVMLDDQILDGRHRELACIRAGVEPKYRKFGSRATDGADPLEFVIDINLHRRHLGEGERAIAAAKYATAKVGRPENQSCPPGTINNPSESCDLEEKTNSAAAEKFKISERKVDRAKAVLNHGTPELQEAVKDETVTVTDAAKVASEKPYVQKKAVEAVRNGQHKSAAAAAKEIKEEKPAPMVDAAGVEIPDNALPAFDDAKELASICREIDGLVARIEEVGKRPGGRLMRTTSQIQTLQNVRKALWASRATHVCPCCKGKGICDSCKSSGWMDRISYSQVPEEKKK